MQKSNRVYHFTSSGKSSDILELSSSESPPGYRPSQGLSFFPSVPLDKLWVESPTWKSSHKTHLSHPSKLVILYRPVSIQEQGTHLTLDEHDDDDDDDDDDDISDYKYVPGFAPVRRAYGWSLYWM